MTENLISYLKTNINYLTSVEGRIARKIIDDPTKFITYTMLDLARDADVSQGSIINFSKKFADGGFPELKLLIAANRSNCDGMQREDIDKLSPMCESLSKMIRSHNAAHILTAAANNEETLASVTEKILNAKKVEIYGVYRSAAVATDFCYQLLELGIPASFVSDILTCSISAAMLGEDSLVVAVSSSGRTKDIIDAVKNAKARNVPIVSITSNAASPLAKLSDDVLIASSSGSSDESNLCEIRASQLLLTDAVCSHIRKTIGPANKERYLEFEKILTSHSVDEGDI